jgi:glycine dehydrogenase subunit 1
MGKQGIPAVANLCLQKAHYMANQLSAIDGIELLFPGAFFKEFAIKTPLDPMSIIKKMRKEKIFAGIDLGRFDYGINNGLLIAVTEKRSREEIDRYVDLLKDIVSV